jgi:hypothetical protein
MIKVVYVYGRHCGICEIVRSTYNKLKEEKPDWDITDLEAESDKRSMEQYNVEATPTWLIFKQNILTSRDEYKGMIEGSRRLKDLISEIEEIAG